MCGKQLASLIDQILDFLKIEQNKLVIEQNPFSLANVIAEALQVLYFGAAENQVELLCDFDPGIKIIFELIIPKRFPS